MMWQSAIANESGKSTMPYLIDHVTNVNGRTVENASTNYSNNCFFSDCFGSKGHYA